MSDVAKDSAGKYTLLRFLDFNGGLNTSSAPNSIALNELQDMENFIVSEMGVLKKRYGLRRMNPEEMRVDVGTTIDLGHSDMTTNTNNAARIQ